MTRHRDQSTQDSRRLRPASTRRAPIASIPSASTDMVLAGEPVTAGPGGRGVSGGCGFGFSGGFGGTRVSMPVTA